MRDFKVVINGKLVSINPTTDGVLAEAPWADCAQLNEIAAAKATFPSWSVKPLCERGALLTKSADALQKRPNEFAGLLREEHAQLLTKEHRQTPFRDRRSHPRYSLLAAPDLPPGVL